MTGVFSAGGRLLTVCVLAVLIATGSAIGARADDPDSGGDITVTVVDPTASASPSPSSLPGAGSGSGSGSGSSTSGHGSSTGGDATGDEPGSAGGSGTGTAGRDIPRWVILSSFGGGAHSELDPFRGWVRSTVTITNGSTTRTVDGVLVFRLHSFLGAQLGPTITRRITGLRPGANSVVSVDLVGAGQWPLLKSSVSFRQSGAGKLGPIEREAWVLGFPWLLMVIAILVVAMLAVARIRRGATLGLLRPEVAG